MYFSRSNPDPSHEPQLVKPYSKTAKCIVAEDSLLKLGTVRLYSVSYDGFSRCRIAGGNLVGSVDCLRSTFNFNTSRYGETHYVVGE